MREKKYQIVLTEKEFLKIVDLLKTPETAKLCHKLLCECKRIREK